MDGEKLSITFSGWTTIDADEAVFVKIEDQSEISGTEWSKLSDDQKSEYAIRSMPEVLNQTEPVWEEIDITEGDIG